MLFYLINNRCTLLCVLYDTTFLLNISNFRFQVKDLILDNTRSTQIEGLTDEYIALESLSLINVGLTSLKGFPKLPNLQKVSICNAALLDSICFFIF